MEIVASPVLTAQHIGAFKKIAGEKFVLVDEESLHHYAHDEQKIANAQGCHKTNCVKQPRPLCISPFFR